MKTPRHFPFDLPLSEQIVFVLSSLKQATASDIAVELMELKGISTEDGLEDLSITIDKEMEKLLEAKRIEQQQSKTETVYTLANN
ncbi:MAG TPA: hypothetical protein VL093_12020 [Flavipsychrobacter sp.]|jgi:hypothetical protein|nr:hypothetical protein [Flavipsychrobacter sp.]